MKKIFFIFAAFALILPIQARQITIKQKASNKTISGKVISLAGNQLKFQLSNRKTFTINLNTLTDESVAKIKEAAKNLTNSANSTSPQKALSGKYVELAQKLNGIIGHPLFSEKSSLWDETSETIAKRLNWRLESLKKSSSSYRLYPKIDYMFLSAHPYCTTLYGGKNDAPEQLSLVFANKGDYGSKFGMGPDHFKKLHPDKEMPKSLNEAIEMDKKLIQESLTSVLGEPEKQYFGEKESKRKVERWDMADHSFILSALEDEYVHLLIVPKSVADSEGKVKFIKDSDLKKIHLSNLSKNDNGDVLITDIPMVNQGPKGYCAPATFERAMRYMQIPADMYLLATMATSPGGGTNTYKLAEESKKIVRSKARKIRDLELKKNLKISKLKKYLDKGVPVLWQMCSLEKYNKIASERTIQRQKASDMKAWAKEIHEEADKVKESLRANINHHICLIIGYNEETKEFAVSDSWGPRYELRWVHEDIAKAVTSYGGFVIDF